MCDLRTGYVSPVLSGREAHSTQVEFAWDDKHILAAGETGLRLLNLFGEDTPLSERDHSHTPMDVSRDRTRLAVATQNGDVHLWQTDDARGPTIIHGNGRAITSLALSSDGQTSQPVETTGP